MINDDERNLLKGTCSEFIVSGRVFKRFRATETYYQSTYDYLSEFLERQGRRIDDVERFIVQGTSWSESDDMEYTREQFLRFSNDCVWDGGDRFWILKGRDFLVFYEYYFWYGSGPAFVPLDADPWAGDGDPYTGENRILKEFEEVHLLEKGETIERIVVRTHDRTFGLTYEQLLNPTEELYDDVSRWSCMAVLTDRALLGISFYDGQAMGLCRVDDRTAHAPADAWGFSPSDSGTHHGWTAGEGGAPDDIEMSAMLETAVQRMVSAGKKAPRAVFRARMDMDFVLLAVDCDDHYDTEDLRAYIQPLVGAKVLLVDLHTYQNYMDATIPLHCLYQDDRRERDAERDIEAGMGNENGRARFVRDQMHKIRELRSSPAAMMIALAGIDRAYITMGFERDDHLAVHIAGDPPSDDVLRDLSSRIGSTSPFTPTFMVYGICGHPTETGILEVIGTQPSNVARIPLERASDYGFDCGCNGPVGADVDICDGILERIAIGNRCYTNMLTGISRLIGRNGFDIGDVSRFIPSGDDGTEFSREQFLRFADMYGWDSDFGEWCMIGDGFVAYWLSTDGAPRTGCVDTAAGPEGRRHAADVSGRMPTEQGAVVFEDDRIAVHDPVAGTAVFRLDLPHAGSDACGLFPEDTVHRHGWSERSTPRDGEISDIVSGAMSRMETDGLEPPDRVFAASDDDGNLFVYADSNTGTYDERQCSGYLRAALGSRVHVLSMTVLRDAMPSHQVECVFSKKDQRRPALPEGFFGNIEKRSEALMNAASLLARIPGDDGPGHLAQKFPNGIWISLASVRPNASVLYVVDDMGGPDGWVHCLWNADAKAVFAHIGEGFDIDDQGLFRIMR